MLPQTHPGKEASVSVRDGSGLPRGDPLPFYLEV